jgi:hypothetical protein
VHLRRDVPEPPGTAEDPRVHDRLVELVVTERLTMPLNPLIGPMEMVELPESPVPVETLEGWAVMVKSWTLYVTVAL